MTLYELTGQCLEVREMAGYEEISTDALNDTMEAVGLEFEEKAENYAKVIKQLEMEADGYKAEAKRLTKKKKVVEANIDRIKKNLEKSMLATGKTKFKTALFSFGIQKNSPSIDLLDEENVPADFRTPQPDKIDKKAILDFLKETNEPVEWATMKQTESLRIR